MYSYNIGYKSDVVKEELIDLLNQSTELFNITEKDFEHIKSKAWYNRLWELITFSNDNEKCLAKNIKSLRKVQDIVLKLLIQFYKEDKEVAKRLSKLTTYVNCISDINSKLVIKLKEIIDFVNFGRKPVTATDFTDSEKRLFVASINSIANEFPDNPSITNFCKMIYNLFDYQCFDKDYTEDMFENISSEKAAFLYQYYLILNYICTKSHNDLHIKIQNIVNCLPISPKIKKIKTQDIIDAINFIGIEGIIEYNNCSEIDLSVTDDGIEFETIIENDDVDIGFETTAADEEAEESNDEVDLSDDTRSQYFDLQELLINRFPSNCVVCIDEEGNYKLNESIIKKVKNFISKNNLIVHTDSAVSMFDTTIFGGAKEGILLTTWGIYHKKLF